MEPGLSCRRSDKAEAGLPQEKGRFNDLRVYYRKQVEAIRAKLDCKVKPG
jgi:hypothetical protein